MDGGIGYLRGYNVGKEYIDENDKPELSPWRDYHLRLEGEGVHDLQTEFCIDWFRAAKNELKNEVKYYTHFNGCPLSCIGTWRYRKGHHSK